MLDQKEILTIALRFRTAIEKAFDTGEFVSDLVFRGFPCGCCGFTSDLLAKYLHEQGVETQYISGNYGYGWTGRSHAWLVTYNGIVIDITRDQFIHELEPLHCENEVYVGTEDEFCKLFKLQPPCPGYEEDIKPAWMGETQPQRDFRIRYEKIIKYL